MIFNWIDLAFLTVAFGVEFLRSEVSDEWSFNEVWGDD